MTHETIPIKLCTNISELADIRTGADQLVDVIDKIIVTVRDFEAFELVYRSPPKRFQALSSVSRACPLEAEQAALRTVLEYQTKNLKYGSLSAFAASAEELFESFLVDSQFGRRPNNRDHRHISNEYEYSTKQTDYKKHSMCASQRREPWDTQQKGFSLFETP